jgi:hypothetical protein
MGYDYQRGFKTLDHVHHNIQELGLRGHVYGRGWFIGY